jgi:hypothetical protein
MAVKSKLSRFFTAGNLASLEREHWHDAMVASWNGIWISYKVSRDYAPHDAAMIGMQVLFYLAVGARRSLRAQQIPQLTAIDRSAARPTIDAPEQRLSEVPDSACGACEPLSSMTKRISTPRRLIRIGTTRRIISSVAFTTGCPPPSGIGILSDK